MYRTSAEEYGAVHRLLQDWLTARPKSACATDPGFAKWFVLWASEWWRREYDGSRISWEPMLESLGCSANVWSPLERSTCISNGLYVWKRSPRDVALRYILSIALEGGLPLRLLATGRGGVGGLLKRVLRQADGCQASGHEIRSWVENLKDMLPVSYQQPFVFMALTDIVLAVLRLKSEAGLTSGVNAIAQLDQQIPDWRGRFPLPLEDEHAQGLLVHLLEEPGARNDAGQQSAPFRLERFLEQQEQDWRICARLPLLDLIEPAQLATCFALPEDDLPRQAELTLTMGDTTLSVVLRRIAGREQYRVLGQFRDVLDYVAAQEHRLGLVFADGRTKFAVAAQGDELDEDLPWIFAEGGACPFLGQGNVRIVDAFAFLLLPKDGCASPEEGAICEPVGEAGRLERTIWRVRGRVRVSCGAEQFAVQTGRLAGEQVEFRWKGKRLWHDFKSPSRAFLGVPKLYLVNAAGVESRAEEHPKFQAQGSGFNLPLGPVVGTYKEKESGASCRTRMVLLPEYARMESLELDACSGLIVLHGWGIAQARTLTSGVCLELAKEAHKATLRLGVAPGNKTPENVELALLWPHTTTPVRLRLPYPAKGARAFGMDGQE